MLPTTNNQLFSATKTGLETELAIWTALSNNAIEGVEKLVDANMTYLKGALDESTAASQRLLLAEPAEFFSVTVGQAQPSLEKALAYGRQVADIASSMQTAVIETTQKTIAESNQKVAELMQDMASNAPDGYKNVFGSMKSTIDNVNAGYEQFAQITQQFTETVKTNLANASDSFAQSAGKSANRAKKK